MKLLNRNLIHLLRRLSYDIKSNNNFLEGVLVNDVETYLGNGSTYSFFDEIRTAYIGIKELSDDPDGVVDDYTFMKGFMALIHESTHVYQREKLLRVNNKSSKYLAVNYMALSASDKYYKSN